MTERYGIVDTTTDAIVGYYETMGEAEDDLAELNDPDFVIVDLRVVGDA